MNVRPGLLTCVLATMTLACGGDDKSDAASEAGDGDGDGSTGDGDGDPTTTGDGDGDPTTGDGDGDPTTGDGDGDPTTGDGDGDPTTGDGDGDPTTGDGDGDGDPTTGDGDGDPSCSGMNESCASGEVCCGDLNCCEGVPVPPGAEYCSNQCPDSDRNLKQGFQTINTQWVLDQLVQLPISTWSYKDGKDGHARHLGPMAQDFHEAFDVGASDRYIFQIDADGVSFAAIQALDAKVEALEVENEQLRATLSELEKRLEALER
jgi:hypothetical protein